MMLRFSRRVVRWKVIHRKGAAESVTTARRPHATSTTKVCGGGGGGVCEDNNASMHGLVIDNQRQKQPYYNDSSIRSSFSRRQRARVLLGNAWLSIPAGALSPLGSSCAHRAFSSSPTLQAGETASPSSSSSSPPSSSTQGAGADQDDGWIDVSSGGAGDGGASTVAAAVVDGATEAGTAVAVTLGHWPSDYILRILDMTHSVTGLEWWQSIIFVTIAVRATMFPLALTAIRNSKNMQLAQPEMLKLKSRYDAIPAAQKTQEAQLAFAREMKALYAKYDFSPFRSLSPMLIQIPVFMGMFFGLKRLGDVFPSAVHGGAFWFPDLMANDSTFVLPILTGVTMLVTTEMGFREQAESAQNATARTVLRGLSASMPVIAAWMPCGVLLYWTTTNVFSLLQSSLFALTPVRAALGIREVPPEVLQETARIQAAGKTNQQSGVGGIMNNFMKQQQEKNTAQRSDTPLQSGKEAEGEMSREGALSASAPLSQGSGSGMNPLVPGMPMNFDPASVHKGKGKKGKGKKGKR